MNGKTIDSEKIEWAAHPNPKHIGVTMRTLVDAQTNPLATVHRVRIAPGGEIVLHTHANSAETFLITSGHALCTMDNMTTEFRAGNTGYAPAGTVHGLKNLGDIDVELTAIFTPPLG